MQPSGPTHADTMQPIFTAWPCGGAMPALVCPLPFCVGLLCGLMRLAAGIYAWIARRHVHAYGQFMSVLDSATTVIGKSGLILFPDMNTMSRNCEGDP
jgi:hypothetical protein